MTNIRPSVDLFNRLTGKQELYRLLDEGLEAMHNGDTIPYKTFMESVKKRQSALTNNVQKGIEG